MIERHPRRRSPWAIVLAASLGLHIIGGIILATIKVVEYVRSPDAQFESPPPAERIEPLKLEYAVQLRQRQADSARPQVQRILVNPVSELNPPPVAAVAPPIAAAGVSLNGAGSGRGGGGGLGLGFGRSAINLAASQVNFFGIRSRAERVLLVVDYTRYMVEDPKGGIPAFRLVKAELEQMVRGLAPGTLFNVAFVNFERLGLFKPAPVPALDEHKAEFSTWLNALAPPVGSRSPGATDHTLQALYPPLEHKTRHWARAIQAGTEMGVDAVFIITPRWHFFPLDMTPQEQAAWARENRWGPAEEAEWQAAVARAQAWLDQENAARRAQGRPPRVVNWIGQIVREREPNLRRPPPPNFSEEEVMDYVRQVLRSAAASGARPPSVNIVLFLGRNERRENDIAQFNDLVRLGRGRLQVLHGLDELRSVTTVEPPPSGR